MQIAIPKELMRYVRMSKKEGLVCKPDMPEELRPLFEQTKKTVLEKKTNEINSYKALIVEEG